MQNIIGAKVQGIADRAELFPGIVPSQRSASVLGREHEGRARLRQTGSHSVSSAKRKGNLSLGILRLTLDNLDCTGLAVIESDVFCQQPASLRDSQPRVYQKRQHVTHEAC